MLYEVITRYAVDAVLAAGRDAPVDVPAPDDQGDLHPQGGDFPDLLRITSYNVCYTKLLRIDSGQGFIGINKAKELLKSLNK